MQVAACTIQTGKDNLRINLINKEGTMDYAEIKKQLEEDDYELLTAIKRAERAMIKELTKDGILDVSDLNYRMVYFIEGEAFQDKVESLEPDGMINVIDSEGDDYIVEILNWAPFEVSTLIDQIKAAIAHDPDYLAKHRVKDPSTLHSHKYDPTQL